MRWRVAAVRSSVAGYEGCSADGTSMACRCSLPCPAPSPRAVGVSFAQHAWIWGRKAMSNWPVHFAGRSLVIFASLLLGTGVAHAASTPIYKCFDKHLALVYTDVPCKDGEQLDLRAGDADPAAVARLERE